MLSFIYLYDEHFNLKKKNVEKHYSIEKGELSHFVFVISCANAWDIFLISTSRMFSTSAPHCCPRLG